MALVPARHRTPAVRWWWVLLTMLACTLCTWLLAAADVQAAGSVPPAGALHFQVFNADDTQAGELRIEPAADGAFTARYHYRNNGRGPDTLEQFRLDADGTPLAYHVTGTTTLGAAIDEHYTREAGLARWRSKADAGERAVAGPALYAAMAGSPALDVVAVAALARQPDGSLPLLPSGRLRQQEVDRLVVQQGGRTQALRLLALTGLGFQPSWLWVADDGVPRLFASVYPGYWRMVEAGWQSALPALEARQRAAEGLLYRQRAAAWLHPLPGLTVVRNARVFDSRRAELGAPSDVYLLRGRITAVLPAGSTRAPAASGAGDGPPGTEIDAAGRVMLPGLFDMHDHAWRGSGGLHLAAGVTTSRDLGSNNATMQQMLDEQAAGQLAYPQIVPAGFIEGESPFASRDGFVINSREQALAAVDWYAQHGYPQVKIYNSFPRELLAETVAHAHARGLRVSGHVPAFMRAEEVVRLGFDEIQHVNQLLLNFLVTDKTDTRTLERFYLPAERLGSLDLDSAPVQDFIALLRQRGTVVDLTLSVFNFIGQRDGQVAAELADVLDHLPPDVQRQARQGEMKIPDDATAQRYSAAVARMAEFAGRLHRAGVPLVAGTDSLAGLVLHSELIAYVRRAGLRPAEVLQLATRNGARFTGTEADRGAIAPGQRADLLLVDGDPTRDINDIRRVALVITQGRWLAPREVHEAIGIRPFVDATPAMRTLATR